MPPALDGLRVVEVGHLVGAAYAAKLLADFGADVIKVEPPDGDLSRRRGPFPGGKPDPEKSGLFMYLNSNKRGITLDLQTRSQRDAFDLLIRSADLLVHNVHPTEMTDLGLEWERLSHINPSLVMASIAPFGQTGPHSTWKGSDLVLWSAGGISALNGDPDRPDLPPLKAFGDQAGFQAALNAAIASLAALFARPTLGRGQHIDVSTQECCASITELTFEFWPYCGLVASRLGKKPIQPLCFMECRDGWIFICCVEEHQWKTFVELMGNPDWADLEIFENRLARGANFDALQVLLQEWCSTQSVQTLYELAQSRRVPLAPVSTMGDLLASDHLRARGFFATIDHSLAGSLSMPGAPFRSHVTPWQLRRPAPCLGQHTDEVFRGLAVDVKEPH